MNQINDTICRDMSILWGKGYNIINVSNQLDRVIRNATHKSCLRRDFRTEDNLLVKVRQGIMGPVQCKVCTHVTETPRLCMITNEGGDGLNVYEHYVHEIKDHNYYGQGSQRVDPELVCKVLGIESSVAKRG